MHRAGYWTMRERLQEACCPGPPSKASIGALLTINSKGWSRLWPTCRMSTEPNVEPVNCGLFGAAEKLPQQRQVKPKEAYRSLPSLDAGGFAS
eukprot:4885602-Amphidinium_carterae.1